MSTADQVLDRQVDSLEAAGCGEIYREAASGSTRARPELERMMGDLRNGDTVVVVKLDRLGRSLTDLIALVGEIREKGCDFTSLGDSIDTSTAQGRMFFAIMASLAEYERELIVERTKDGLAAARRRGRVGGRPRADADKVALARDLHEHGGYTVKEICSMVGISRSTFYKYIN